MRLRFALSFALLLLLGGCTTARIPVPESLASAERLPVEGRQGFKIKERLRFGPYLATDIQRSWTRGSDLQVQVYEGSKRVQQYRFTLQEESEAKWEVSCGAFLRMRDADFDVLEVEFENRGELNCTLTPIGDALEWAMSLRGENGGPLEGTLTNGDATLRVTGTRRLENALSPDYTTGYEILYADRAIAAVEVINNGAVWLAPTHHGQDLFAATAASLLLYEDLRASVDREP